MWHESSLHAIGAPEGHAAASYTATVVSKVAAQVLTSASPSWGAVHRYQTSRWIWPAAPQPLAGPSVSAWVVSMAKVPKPEMAVGDAQVSFGRPPMGAMVRVAVPRATSFHPPTRTRYS